MAQFQLNQREYPATSSLGSDAPFRTAESSTGMKLVGAVSQSKPFRFNSRRQI
jgi:hypothetical protein